MGTHPPNLKQMLHTTNITRTWRGRPRACVRLNWNRAFPFVINFPPAEHRTSKNDSSIKKGLFFQNHFSFINNLLAKEHERNNVLPELLFLNQRILSLISDLLAKEHGGTLSKIPQISSGAYHKKPAKKKWPAGKPEIPWKIFPALRAGKNTLWYFFGRARP